MSMDSSDLMWCENILAMAEEYEETTGDKTYTDKIAKAVNKGNMDKVMEIAADLTHKLANMRPKHPRESLTYED